MRLIIILILILKTNFIEAKLPETNVPGYREKLDSGSSGLISTATHKKLERVHIFLNNKKYTEAISLLLKLADRSQKRPVELAQIYQTMGFTYAQNDKEFKAIQALEKALKTKGLPIGPALSSMYLIAQLELSQGQTKKAIESLLHWFKHVESPQPEAYIMLGSAYATLENNKSALEVVEKALSLSDHPKKSWLQFAVALNYELNNYKKAIYYLEILTAQDPNDKRHWKQLSGLYAQTGEDQKALAALKLSDLSKHLESESDYLNLVSFYLNVEIPYWAAKTLEKAIKEKKVKKSKKSLQLLAQSYLQAEEVDKALPALKEAAQFSKDGELYLLEGQIYLEKEDWRKAKDSFEMSLKKGQVKEKGFVHLGLALAQFNLGQKSKAQNQFHLALNFKNTKSSAEQWLKHIEQ